MNVYLQQIDENLKKDKFTGQIIVHYGCGTVQSIELLKKEILKVDFFVLKST